MVSAEGSGNMLEYDEIVVFVVDEDGNEKKHGPVQWSADVQVGKHMLLRLDADSAKAPESSSTSWGSGLAKGAAASCGSSPRERSSRTARGCLSRAGSVGSASRSSSCQRRKAILAASASRPGKSATGPPRRRSGPAYVRASLVAASASGRTASRLPPSPSGRSRHSQAFAGTWGTSRTWRVRVSSGT